jgi:hypothetical protein
LVVQYDSNKKRIPITLDSIAWFDKFATFFGKVPEIFGTLPMTLLVMDKGNRFHPILLEILRLISTGLRSWSFNTILTKREYQLRWIVLLGLTVRH